ncbi:hypothetical protein SCUCBS95973_008573 [Sporothrix curviconia]|uniref:DEUBAD domain-containing protein n=1 Tax=Sporothrix curviconia TaxID=1260050 RepID=A0ABP0CQJ8_9PEZI
MDSSPLSSPPASVMLGGDEGGRESTHDGDEISRFMAEEPDDASEIDLILVSPEASPRQQVTKAFPVQAALPQGAPEVPELAGEAVTVVADTVVVARNTAMQDEPASSLDEGLEPGPGPEPEPEPVARSAFATEVTRATGTSPLRYTNNTFALVPSSSPQEETKVAEATSEDDTTKEGEKNAAKETERRGEMEEDDGKDTAANAPRAKARSRPRSRPQPRQRRSKTSADADAEKNEDIKAAPDPASVPAPAVIMTRSGRRVIPKQHVDEEPSPAKPPPKRTPAKAKTARTAAKATARPVMNDTKEDKAKDKATPKMANGARGARGEPSPSAAVLRRRRQAAARWQTDFVLANTRSPLIHFDLRTLLCQPEAWSALDADEQQDVLALLPPDAGILDAGTDKARPDVASLKNDNNFRHDCARYRSDLAAGFLNKNWLEEAFEAHAMRQEGLFDAYVIEAFESSWGVEVPGVYRKDRKEQKEETEEKEEAPAASRKRSRDVSVKADDNGKDVTGEALQDATRPDGPDKAVTPLEAPAEAPAEALNEDRSPKRQKQETEEREIGVDTGTTESKDEAPVSVPMRGIQQTAPAGDEPAGQQNDKATR